MRIDKFLKVSRIIKRRTVAKEACDLGRVEVNGRPAKAGTEVTPGDSITVRFGSSTMSVRVLLTCATAGKDDAASMYEVI